MSGYDSVPDLAFMMKYAPGSVAVSLGGSATFGVLNTTDEDLLAAEAAHLAGTVTVLELVTGSLAGLAEDAVLTFNGRTWRAVMIRRVADGLVTRVYCA